MTKLAVIYYSATGNVHALAEAVADRAGEAGAQVRLRRVAELAPTEAIDSNPAWRAHADPTADIKVAAIDDVRWADALAFGSPHALREHQCAAEAVPRQHRSALGGG